MLDLLFLAFDEKYTKEEITEWLDLDSVPKVFEIFYGLSSLKKKQAMMMKQQKQSGISYTQVSFKTLL